MEHVIQSEGRVPWSVFNTLKTWSDKRSITWLREHAKLRRTGKQPQ